MLQLLNICNYRVYCSQQVPIHSRYARYVCHKLQLCCTISLQGILHCYNYPLLPLPRASAMRNCNSASVHITDGQLYGVSDIKVAAMSQPCLGWDGREKGKGERGLQDIPASYRYNMYDYIIEWSLKSSGIVSINQLLI